MPQNLTLTTDQLNESQKELKPLSVEEIKNLTPEPELFADWMLSFARAIEERHGIK